MSLLMMKLETGRAVSKKELLFSTLASLKNFKISSNLDRSQNGNDA